MTISTLSLLAAAADAGGPPVWLTVLPYAGIAAVFWFLILRPQMRAQKDQRAKIAGIKKGDQVLTGGGLLAKVIKVDESYAELEIATGIKVKALKSTIADVIPPAGAAND